MEIFVGGRYIHVGCIPSKFLITNGENAAKKHDKAAFYKDTILRKRELLGKLRGKNYDKLDSLDTVDIIDGTARFIFNHEIDVDGTIYQAEKVFINTGGESVVPNLPGIDNMDKVYFSDGLLDLEVLPAKLLIVGGGYIGLEFASMYSNFGSQVTVLKDGPRLIPREDQDIADEVQKVLEAKGVKFILGGKADLNKAREEFDAILVATGRKPNTENLGLENTDVKLTDRGAVITDENLKTTADNIWAMGDVTGGLQFTYTSLDDYRVVLSA